MAMITSTMVESLRRAYPGLPLGEALALGVERAEQTRNRPLSVGERARLMTEAREALGLTGENLRAALAQHYAGPRYAESNANPLLTGAFQGYLDLGNRLLDRTIYEAYMTAPINPLMAAIPEVTVSRQEEDGVTMPFLFDTDGYDVVTVANPGEPSQRSGANSLRIRVPRLYEQALTLEVTEKMVAADQWGRILELATQTGRALRQQEEVQFMLTLVGRGYQFEYSIGDGAFTSVSPYLYTGDAGPWINAEGSVTLTSEAQLQDVETKLANQQNLVNDRYLGTKIRHLVTGVSLGYTARKILSASTVRPIALDDPNAFDTRPLFTGQNVAHHDPILFKDACVSTTIGGGNGFIRSSAIVASAAAADLVWVAGDVTAAIRRFVSVPLQVRAGIPDYDKRIIAPYYANLVSLFAFVAPQKVYRVKAEAE